MGPDSTDAPIRDQSPDTGRLMFFAGCCLLVGSPIVGFLLSQSIGPIVNVINSVGVAFGGLLIIRGRRHLARSGLSALATDKRPPILFLRQFSDDGAKYLPLLLGRRRLSYRFFFMRTYEERLGWALRHLGPMVAIGRPGESLPELGAARIYVGDALWQDKVLELIARAQIVVLQIGETSGIRWEIEQVVAQADPTKLVLCLPMGGKGTKGQEIRYQRFRELNAAAFPVPLPATMQGAQFVYFDQNWKPHLLAPGIEGRRTVQKSYSTGKPSVLWRALDALNEEFLQVMTPAIVRIAMMLPLAIVIYPIFALMIFKHADRALGSTTFFGLYPTYAAVVRESKPHLDGLRQQLAEIALAVKDPGLLPADGQAPPLDPPPLYDARADRYNADLIMAEQLVNFDARPEFDFMLGNIRAVLSSVYSPPATLSQSEEVANRYFRQSIDRVLNLRYLVTVAVAAYRPVEQSPAGEVRGSIAFRVFVTDLRRRMFVRVFVVTVDARDLPHIEAGQTPEQWRGYLWLRARARVVQELSRHTGGTFVFM